MTATDVLGTACRAPGILTTQIQCLADIIAEASDALTQLTRAAGAAEDAITPLDGGFYPGWAPAGAVAKDQRNTLPEIPGGLALEISNNVSAIVGLIERIRDERGRADVIAERLRRLA